MLHDQYITELQIRQKSVLMYARKFSNSKKADARKLLKSDTAAAPAVTLFGGVRSYSGRVTDNQKRRIIRACSLLSQISDWKSVYCPISNTHKSVRLTFITLTVSENTRMLSAREGYEKLLKPFLRWLRECADCHHYIWKAELQQRGQIHWHITTNKYIHYSWIKAAWNKFQQNAGLLKNYYKEHGHYHPNSTDIHAVYNDENIEQYLAKYIAKSGGEDERIDGKVWDCSLSLKGKKYFTTELLQHHKRKINEGVQRGKIEVIKKENFTIFRYKQGKGSDVLHGYEHNRYWHHLKQIYNLTSCRKSEKKMKEKNKVKSTLMKQMTIEYEKSKEYE